MPTGDTLEIEATDEFLKIVASHFSLESVEDISDSHVAEFVYSATMNALEKAEKDPKNESAGCSQIKLV